MKCIECETGELYYSELQSVIFCNRCDASWWRQYKLEQIKTAKDILKNALPNEFLIAETSKGEMLG